MGRRGGSKASADERAARFVEAYLTLGENALRAYLEVYPGVTDGTAKVEGHRLLTKPNVQKAIEKRRLEIRAAYSLTTDRVYQELARVAYFSPKKLVDHKGKSIPLHKLDDDTAAGLARVEIIETTVEGRGKDKVVTTRKIKGTPYNKTTALGQAGKILRLHDRPPPPPPEQLDKKPQASAEEMGKRMLFLLAAGAAAGESAAEEAKPKPKKKVRQAA